MEIRVGSYVMFGDKNIGEVKSISRGSLFVEDLYLTRHKVDSDDAHFFAKNWMDCADRIKTEYPYRG